MLDLPEPALYIVIFAVIVAGTPRFGRAILAFLRDLDDYLARRKD